MDDHEIILIEAALYVAGRPLDTKTLGSIIGTRSKKKVRKLARTLLKDYLKYDGALELVELDGDQFALQLKPRYVQHVRRLSMRAPLTIGPLKPLSYIAYHQPVAQSHVAKIRGSNAYKHIRALEALDLIATEKMGKTKIIRTTDAFLEYLNLSHDPKLMKRQLRALFKSLNKKNGQRLTLRK